MNYRATTLAIFPVSFLALLSMERLSTYLLGLSPSSAALWKTSLELRALFRDLSNQLGLATGQSLLFQSLLLSACILTCCLAAQSRRWAVFSFLTNHITLIVAATATMVAMNFKVASFGYANSIKPAAWFATDIQVTWLQLAVLMLGAVSCLCCHYVFLTRARKEQALIRLQLKKLQ